jgi:hypothetical protein
VRRHPIPAALSCVSSLVLRGLGTLLLRWRSHFEPLVGTDDSFLSCWGSGDVKTEIVEECGECCDFCIIGWEGLRTENAREDEGADYVVVDF